MPQSNREIIPGWECLNFDINDEIWKVPSLQMIEELIFFPNLDSPDPYHLERYRIRPQNYEPENQKLLLIESNELVDLFERSEMDSYQLQVSKWCQEKGISYQEFLYHELSSTYCRQILVPSNPNPDKLRHLAPRLISLSPIDGTNCGGEIHDRLEAEFKNNQTKLNEVFNRVVLLNINCKTSNEIKSSIDKGKPLTQHVIKRIENSKNINNDGKKLLISLKDLMRIGTNILAEISYFERELITHYALIDRFTEYRNAYIFFDRMSAEYGLAELALSEASGEYFESIDNNIAELKALPPIWGKWGKM